MMAMVMMMMMMMMMYKWHTLSDSLPYRQPPSRYIHPTLHGDNETQLRRFL
jgi:hypothetical protein